MELEAELAAAALEEGALEVIGSPDEEHGSLVTAGGEAQATDEAAGEPGAPEPEADSAREGTGEVRAGTSASRRSVDELFARIRASRAAEDAAAEAAVAAAEVAAGEAEAAVVAEAMAAAEARAAADNTGDPAGSEPAIVTEATATEPAEVAAAPGAQLSGDAGEASEAAVQEEHTAEVPAVAVAEHPGAAVAPEPTGAVEVPPEEAPGQAGAPAEASETSAPDEGAADAGEATAGDADDLVEGGPDTVPVPQVKGRLRDLITEPDVESLARRDHLLAPVSAKLGRALKRALQDDQNDLLNALRKTTRAPVLDELIPAMAQRERFVAAASDQLAKAYEAGAAFLVTGDRVEGPSVSAPVPSEATAFEAGAAIAAQLADDLSSMLRHRIEAALSELEGSTEGSADAAGVAYREWKGSRVEGLAGDFTTRAFAVGELAVLASVGNGGAPLVRWAVEDDDGGGSCPDCDDNSLAGPQVPGIAFPTGHAHPPVHPGCRCLLVPVRS